MDTESTSTDELREKNSQIFSESKREREIGKVLETTVAKRACQKLKGVCRVYIMAVENDDSVELKKLQP